MYMNVYPNVSSVCKQLTETPWFAFWTDILKQYIL